MTSRVEESVRTNFAFSPAFKPVGRPRGIARRHAIFVIVLCSMLCYVSVLAVTPCSPDSGSRCCCVSTSATAVPCCCCETSSESRHCADEIPNRTDYPATVKTDGSRAEGFDAFAFEGAALETFGVPEHPPHLREIAATSGSDSSPPFLIHCAFLI